MKKLVAVMMILIISFSTVNADVFGFSKFLVKAKVNEVKKINNGRKTFDKKEKERVEKWNKWGQDILDKQKTGVKFPADIVDKANKAVNYKGRTYEEFLRQQEIREKTKEYGNKLKQRKENGFWRYYGSKLFGSWVQFAFNEQYSEPKKKKTKINKASGTDEIIPESFDTNVDMPVELLQYDELDVYFYTVFPDELPFSDLWNRNEKIEKLKKDYALAVPYEVFFENIVEASESQCKVMYEQLKVKSEVGESQKETLLRIFVFDYERRTESKLKGLYRDITNSLEESYNMMNEHTPVPTPTPLPIAY